MATGRAWRWPIPKRLQQCKSINFLEFLACVVGYFLAVHDGELAVGDCVLSLADNTSAAGWLRKSNFAPEGEQAAHFGLARELAATALDTGTVLFSQWICGLDNEVADCLSRDDERSDAELTEYILFAYSDSGQIPSTFKVSKLPDELSSLLSFWVQQGTEEMELPQGPTPRPTPHGKSGTSLSTNADCKRTPIWTPSPATLRSSSLGHSPKLSDSADTASPLKGMISWLQLHVAPPSIMWQRPSPKSSVPIQARDPMASLHMFYSASSKATRTTTRERNTNKPSQSS